MYVDGNNIIYYIHSVIPLDSKRINIAIIIIYEYPDGNVVAIMGWQPAECSTG